MLSFDKVTKIFNCKGREIRALNEVSFQIKEGEFVSFVGKSGAGKTTIAKIIIAEYQPTFGDVIFQGEQVHQLRSADLQKLRRKIGVVHQDYKLLNDRTVKENLEYILQVLAASDETIENDVLRVLEIVNLEDKSAMFPLELSGGEQQRLAIARALIHRPELIIADEPTGNLDPYSTYEVISLLTKIHKLGSTVLLFTHNKEVINNLKKRVITLEEGKIIRDDPKGKFLL
ncbi:ATP-binding cassette domain-containing protein [Candidatus Gribaldobacteria bacterium]|nr:ATP-binding cassette domain-containing protein [Candidatus Gribaldobacteria bacterium]